MKPIPVVALPPGDQWDQTLLDDLISGTLWPHGLEFERFDAYPMDAEGIVLVVPGRYYADRTAEISEAIARYSWVLGFRCGDEEDLLDIREVDHPNVRWWLQTPRVGRDYGAARLLPLGPTPHFGRLATDPPEKVLDLFISAQATHERRRECFEALTGGDHAVVEQTAGFTQGMAPQEYVAHMAAAKVAPCPSGAVSPDSFRVYEALEAHCVPIVDDISPSYDSRGYWRMLFGGDPPFPVLTDYKDLPGYINDVLRDWPAISNRVAASWIRHKRDMAHWLRDDLAQLGVL